jgi:hypothetical protein
MVFDATFNNISVISWGLPGETHRPAGSRWKFCCIKLTLVVISSDDTTI